MKTFKEYLKNKKPKFVVGPHSFSELRHIELNEGKYDEMYDIGDDTHHSVLHDHPDVEPQNLSNDHIEAIRKFGFSPSAGPSGEGSSVNINNYLTNAANVDKNRKILSHTPEAVHKAAQTLSSAFTPENTIRKKVTAYGAVNSKLGQTLLNSKKGDITTFPGFTSTSATSNGKGALKVAKMFAARYRSHPESDGVNHIIKATLHPGSALSLPHYAYYEDENEMLIHPGTHFKYSHSVKDENGDYAHHISVLPTHEPLPSYGKYSEQKTTTPTPNTNTKKSNTSNGLYGEGMVKVNKPNDLQFHGKLASISERHPNGDLTAKIHKDDHSTTDKVVLKHGEYENF